ncbi:HAUS augmin-like complex subunit 4 [Geodia barretti]|uniref:HAUS augmin-like complex subunit 4 n=1 Tax=Geodia barretti TaxID=519541 RepID=A0AA35WZZ4_GEOBA|nr:HAUS augmin-like complex subunit 4 [Geodia barretti]
MAEETETPGFSRLMELLQGSYLRKGVRKSVASKLEETEARLQGARRRYLELSLVHSELAATLDRRHASSTTNPRSGRPSDDGGGRGGREVLAAGEAQHCLRLHPQATLLGLSSDHLRLAGGRPLTGTGKEAVLREVQERLKAKCLRVAQWHSEGKASGSESLQLAKAAQLPGLVAQQINSLDSVEAQLREKRKENALRQHQHYKILVETSEMLHGALEQARLGSVARSEQVRLDYLQARTTALLGKQDVMYYQLLKGICSDGRLQALKEIRSLMAARLRGVEEQLAQTQHTLRHYHSLGPELASLAQQYAATLAEIENKQWALTELLKSCPTTN